jgi:hypothetical protein
MIGEELIRYDKTREYVFFDCESCNLNLAAPENLPWQWGWKHCTLERTISEGSFLVKWPNLRVSKGAARITGFYQPKVDQYGITPEEGLERIESLLSDPKVTLVAHNALNFDIYLHQIHRRALGLSEDYSYLGRLIDSNAIAKAWKLGVKIPKDSIEFLAFQYKMAGYFEKGLKTSILSLCSELEVPYDPSLAHDALYDVQLLEKIWKKLIWKVEL